MAQAVERLAAQKVSKNQSAQQSEKMGAEVCPFSGTPQHGQKRHPGHEGDAVSYTHLTLPTNREV